MRRDLAEALDRQLEEYGVPRGTSKVSDQERDHIIALMKQDQDTKQQKLPKYAVRRIIT